MQSNEELISEIMPTTTPCELVESLDHSKIENWKDMNVIAGPDTTLEQEEEEQTSSVTYVEPKQK